MGLISNRPSYFVLSGQDGDYNSVGNVEHWMQQNLYRLGGRTLQQVCVPSSHDSGMSKVTFKTKFASIGTVATQYVSVESQLRYGVRYFDIRPTLYKDEWSCGHWSFIDPKPWVRFLPFNSWQGGNGESIKEVIEGVNSFTASSNELVILSLYRAFAVRDTDDAFRRDDFADLQEHQWRSLLDILTGEAGLKHLWRPTEGDGELEVKDLTTIPLQRFIGGPEAAVIIILDANFDVTKYPGCFPQSAWQWDCSDWQKRENERLQEFQQQAAKQNGRPYSYSGCHTQTDDEAIASTLGQSSSSVLELAVDAKDKLFTELFPACSEKVHPCAMNMDAIDSSDLAALAMAMNDRSSK
ncbi:hypothetical protein MMC11_000048 [Xylographa trunciseda]|nr:hypothetical protein [Xylographa trunciseda]